MAAVAGGLAAPVGPGHLSCGRVVVTEVVREVRMDVNKEPRTLARSNTPLLFAAKAMTS